MRSRSLIALSALAASALFLAGCSGAQEKPDAAKTDAPKSNVCESVASEGDASKNVKVTGEFGEVSELKFDLNQEVKAEQRTVLKKGDGKELKAGDFFSYAISAFDGTTGERIGDAGYADGELMPAQLAAETPLSTLIGCVAVGTRLSVVLPATETAPGQFYIVDVLDDVPSAAWGKTQEAVSGMPAVKLDDKGEPTITIPDTDAPTELKVSVLKKGDGPEVTETDGVMVQYTGVAWDTGKVFDTSWDDGVPLVSALNQLVPGFTQAVAGQKVGSQILVTIPPALAYGAEPSEDNELAGKTLVFVIDLIGYQKAAPAAGQ